MLVARHAGTQEQEPKMHGVGLTTEIGLHSLIDLGISPNPGVQNLPEGGRLESRSGMVCGRVCVPPVSLGDGEVCISRSSAGSVGAAGDVGVTGSGKEGRTRRGLGFGTVSRGLKVASVCLPAVMTASFDASDNPPIFLNRVSQSYFKKQESMTRKSSKIINLYYYELTNQAHLLRGTCGRPLFTDSFFLLTSRYLHFFQDHPIS